MFRLLFTEYERKHPFRSLHHTGLVLPFLIQICFNMFLVRGLNGKLGNIGPLLDHFDGEEWWKVFNHPVWKEWARMGAYWLIVIISVAFLAPADTIVTRLAIQPVHGKPQPVDRDVEKLLDAGTIAPPSYLNLTTEQPPYLGFMDCFHRIVEDEGWGVLYRSWLLTLVGCLVPFLR